MIARLFLTVLTCAMVPLVNVLAQPLELGARAPAVQTINHQGEPLDLGQAAEKGWVLVYFYPKADTPGCTAQACSIRDSFAELTDRGVRVFGVSMDTPADQAAFRTKYKLPFDLVADSAGAVVKAYGVPSMGAFAKRQAFLFRDGVLVWRDLSASTGKQAADVLAALQSAAPAQG